MALLNFSNIQYTTSQTSNPFYGQSGNPFMPAASAYPMGMVFAPNMDYSIPFMQMPYDTSFSLPSIFNFGTILNSGSNNSGRKSQSSVSLSSGNLGKDIVATAKQYIGYNEKDGSYKLFTNGRKEAWCADFATYVTKEALRANGKSIPSGFGSSSVAGLKSWGQKNGRYTTDVSQAKPGDIVIFNWSHTGIVKNILADGTVITIEGNTSDKVAERKYSPSSGKINGFVQVA